MLRLHLWSIPLLVACGSTPKTAKNPIDDDNGLSLTVPDSGVPKTATHDVVDSYHGTAVHDAYRWLEAPSDMPEVKAFIEAQNAHARGFLDRLPEREPVRARLAEILGAATVAYGAPREVGGQLFALKLEPPKQQRMLVVMPSPDAPDKERVLVDPTTIDATGRTSIDWYRVAPDGKHVAVSISAGGSESGNVRVFEVASGNEVFEVVPGVNAGTAGGDLAWLPDSSGFYYSRYPRGDERPAEDKLFYVQLYRHTLGKPTSEDSYELGKEFPRIAEVFIDVDKNGDALCTIQKGDGGEFELYLQRGGYKARGQPSGPSVVKAAPWVKLAGFEDRIVQGFFGPKDSLYLVSRKDAPRGKLLRIGRGQELADAKVILAEDKDAALVSDIWDDHVLAVHDGRLYVSFQLGGPSELRVFDLEGKPQPAPEQLPVASVGHFMPLGKRDLLFAQSSFVSPAGWYRYSPAKKATAKTAISMRSPVDLVGMGVQVTRVMAPSKDGTQVPVNLVLPKGAVKGTPIPFLVTGYGGYGVSMEPTFQALRSVLLERGVGLALVNLRGGGELGQAWHEAGMLTKKQNVFDDFIGAVEYLVAEKYAAPGRIGITGASNGGLLMGAVLTQRPDLFAAVTGFVGIYDMLRFETEPNGAFNTTEFGSTADEAQFAALYAYSPYHRVQDGVAYPPTLLMTGANDVRVAPWQSRKMAARLQAASTGEAPHLLVTTFGAGHGIGSAIDQIIAQQADGFAFLLHHIAQQAPQ